MSLASSCSLSTILLIMSEIISFKADNDSEARTGVVGTECFSFYSFAHLVLPKKKKINLNIPGIKFYFIITTGI